MLPNLNYEAERLRQQVARLQTSRECTIEERPDPPYIVKLDLRLDPDPHGLHGLSIDHRLASMKVN